MRIMRRVFAAVAATLCLVLTACVGSSTASPGEPATPRLGNSPQAVEAFRDMALGMFIHWGVDAQLGSVISHSLVGASEDYRRRFFAELPRTFNPRDYDPGRLAELARVCGVKYVVPTAKHHSGFCLFPTDTTPFQVANTRYGKDLIGPLAAAVRREGLALGLYFSPEDFWFLDRQGKLIARRQPHALPTNNPELLEHVQEQVRELSTRYHPVDVWFFDGRDDPVELKQMVWAANPRAVVTRGEMKTPEQRLPGELMTEPWEACFTLGTQWQFKPTNESYKSGTELIDMLIETRAKGGNLLLNVGPSPEGRVPFEQERLLRELGLWLFLNGEAIYRVRPWVVAREGDLWFTCNRDDDALYVFLTGIADWKRGQRREFVIRSARRTDRSEISVLGQNDRVVEYQPKALPTSRMTQRADGLHLSVVRAQRIYNDSRWPNPVVVKLTGVEPVRQTPDR